MKKTLIITLLVIFSAAYAYFFLGVPYDDTDAGFLVRCNKDRYHSFRIDESFVAHGKRLKPGFGYEAVEPLADVYLQTACKYGMPSDVLDQRTMLLRVKDDFDSLKIPADFTRIKNYELYYYPGTVGFVGSFIIKLFFLAFIDAIVLLWIKD